MKNLILLRPLGKGEEEEEEEEVEEEDEEGEEGLRDEAEAPPPWEQIWFESRQIVINFWDRWTVVSRIT